MIFVVKSFLGNFYRHLAIFSGHTVSSLTRLELTKEENMLFVVGSEAAESKLVKLENSSTVILPLTVSALWVRATRSR